MSFERFNRVATGRIGFVDEISITRTTINFGKRTPPEYVVIEYDIENQAIRFSAGNKQTGYKALRTRSTNYINAYSFIKRGLLDVGHYKLVEDWTYQRLASPTKEETK